MSSSDQPGFTVVVSASSRARYSGLCRSARFRCLSRIPAISSDPAGAGPGRSFPAFLLGQSVWSFAKQALQRLGATLIRPTVFYLFNLTDRMQEIGQRRSGCRCWVAHRSRTIPRYSVRLPSFSPTALVGWIRRQAIRRALKAVGVLLSRKRPTTLRFITLDVNNSIYLGIFTVTALGREPRRISGVFPGKFKKPFIFRPPLHSKEPGCCRSR
ncbi:hypothetical protein Metal_1202 [Methylomicrobium album BG8]|uniref:Uncharacterized protein n=1 Tax=Methylomicrobium album BG8 TaxID=686340 RepID=H8GII6_METAL|nr:hypothetical protein Metal_1202 [Methylomicrobium album BG8]